MVKIVFVLFSLFVYLVLYAIVNKCEITIARTKDFCANALVILYLINKLYSIVWTVCIWFNLYIHIQKCAVQLSTILFVFFFFFCVSQKKKLNISLYTFYIIVCVVFTFRCRCGHRLSWCTQPFRTETLS